MGETLNPGAMNPWVALVLFLILSFSAAGIGSYFTVSEVPGWYKQLAKPTWNPPGWVFGPVWSALYTMIGISAWLVWRKVGLSLEPVWVFFALQWLFNTLWSVLFFGWHAPGWALVDISLLWLSILATLVAFFRVTNAAGWLFVPYLLWVSFALVLNATIWHLNR